MYVMFNKELQLKPIKVWATDIKEGALQQAINLSNLHFLFKHVALMPDVHQGYGMPIGGVIACKDIIIPNAVGVDIGCGMCAVMTPWKVNEITEKQLKKIMSVIRELIPVGFNHSKIKCSIKLMPLGTVHSGGIVEQQFESARYQLGTLGGGNHFIEIQKDEHSNIWIMIHSGSRNLGHKVATYYNKKAKIMNKQWHVGIPTNYDLAYFPIATSYAKEYRNEMQYCIDFALANRKLMMLFVKEAFWCVMKHKTIGLSNMINIAHNYASFENHFGENVLVHRKGATLAREGTIGIIPGSQGTPSYIVEGLGNPQSFTSCSHGAGRVMGRAEAKRKLNLTKEIDMLNKQNIIHSIRTKEDLDEAPSAYKDIDVVMKNQEDLVKIVTKLTPLAVIKG